ncbi:MAG TPA: EI24 domain-containing protein [Bacteroidales bacterium]|nr:EI24 domain-containing protein [Bacteroidales bacterium]HPS26062.1 EI24 domain-containing protein [Bacteroidales bacterium]
MALFPNFKLGYKSYGEAHQLIVKNRLWGYVFVPAIINIIILFLVIFFGWKSIGLFTDWIINITGLAANPSGFFRHLIIFFKWLFKIGLYVLLFLFYFSVYRYLVLAILSPALALLSEKTDKILTGTNYPFRLWQLIKDIKRGILIVVRNFFIEMGFMIVFFFLSYIPIVGWISPFIMFFITCYFYGFSMIDYSNERYKYNIRESVLFVRKNRGMSISNGMVFYLFFFFVPVVGFLFAPAYSVVAATIAVSKVRNKQLTKSYQQKILSEK